MKTLSYLIQEAEESFDKKFYASDYDLAYSDQEQEYIKIKNFLKNELTNIVKESFKNTRVEEIDWIWENGECSVCGYNSVYYEGSPHACRLKNQALSDKHNKECEFLGN